MTVKANVAGGAMVTPTGKLIPIIADKGDTGQSAYQLWLAAGNVGTEAQYLASLRGASIAGDKGWSPILAGELDGTRTLMRVADWAGGQGTKPDAGMYIGTAGYVSSKAQAFNFNTSKRFGVFSAVSNAQGIAAVSFGSIFADSAAAPAIGHWGIPATAVGGVETSVVAGTLSKAGVSIRVRAPGLLGSALTLLVGATVFVIASET